MNVNSGDDNMMMVDASMEKGMLEACLAENIALRRSLEESALKSSRNEALDLLLEGLLQQAREERKDQDAVNDVVMVSEDESMSDDDGEEVDDKRRVEVEREIRRMEQELEVLKKSIQQ
jgi:hypothetical protein